ncbi:MAG: hypothetical protein PHX40_01270 [Bacilli bacterium]|nr:hypothetical protein [Bacilli bacterium]
MNNIEVDLSKMLSLENELIALKDKFLNKINEINANIDSIDSNWDGKKSTDSLKNIEEIKKEYTDLILVFQEKIDVLTKARITYEKETHRGVESIASVSQTPNPTSTPSATDEPIVAPILTPPPTLEPTDSSNIQDNSYMQNANTIKVDNGMLRNLGVKFDGDVPRMYQNAYIASLGGMDYLVSFPKNNFGETQTNLPVFVEFHGNSASKNWEKAGVTNSTSFNAFMAGPVMGLKATQNNPNLPAIIIMPQSSVPGFIGNNLERVHNIYTTVSSSLDSDKAGFNANVFSAGGSGFYRYCKEYSSDVKAAYIVDPSTYADKLSNVPQNIPVYVFTSTDSGPYNSQFLKAVDNLNANLTTHANLSKDEPIELLNMIGNPNLNGYNLINVNNTKHEELRDLVFTQDFFNTVLAKDFNQPNMWMSASE